MMDNLEKETPPPDLLKARVMRSLEQQGLLRGTRRPWMVALHAAALLTAFIAGWLISGSMPTVPDASLPGGSRYLLLLYEDAAYQPDRPPAELVAEYSAWLAGLQSQGRIASGEQLGSDAWLIAGEAPGESAPRSGPYGSLTGFFIIVAGSPAEAFEIARTCPHLRHGGRIAVRPVVGA